MLLTESMTDYLRYILHERGLSVKTHKGYQSQLRHFQRWLTENGFPDPTIECLTVSLCRRYLYHLSGRGLRPRSIRSYCDPFDGLCRFLLENGLLTGKPGRCVDTAEEGCGTTFDGLE